MDPNPFEASRGDYTLGGKCPHCGGYMAPERWTINVSGSECTDCGHRQFIMLRGENFNPKIAPCACSGCLRFRGEDEDAEAMGAVLDAVRQVRKAARVPSDLWDYLPRLVLYVNPQQWKHIEHYDPARYIKAILHVRDVEVQNYEPEVHAARAMDYFVNTGKASARIPGPVNIPRDEEGEEE